MRKSVCTTRPWASLVFGILIYVAYIPRSPVLAYVTVLYEDMHGLHQDHGDVSNVR